jgi:3-hydroxyacyl-CoA dehydrogenase/enoyl-CoA hydratase/3-hydroxybutyryl-CoA epimerase/enoyl-CoA isomerase
MIYSGKAITVRAADDGIAELCFDLQDESVNKFNALTVNELKDATAAIAADTSLKGVIVTSGKPVFIVGADITEFGALFGASEDEIADRILKINLDVFNAFEDLRMPTVAAINGIALGGGLEMGLVCDYRVMSETARVGFPETKLGIIPGYGGTTRLPRLIGADNAIEWIASGKEQTSDQALRCGAVDAVVAPELLREAAAEQDRGHDGVRDVQSLCRRPGRTSLPGSDHRHQGHGKSGRDEPRRCPARRSQGHCKDGRHAGSEEPDRPVSR